MEDNSGNGLYYSALHEKFAREHNERQMGPSSRIDPYKVYETTDGQVVAATREATGDYINTLRGRFNDYARVGVKRSLLATPSEVTGRGKEIAAERGVPATFEGLSKITINRKF